MHELNPASARGGRGGPRPRARGSVSAPSCESERPRASPASPRRRRAPPPQLAPQPCAGKLRRPHRYGAPPAARRWSAALSWGSSTYRAPHRAGFVPPPPLAAAPLGSGRSAAPRGSSICRKPASSAGRAGRSAACRAGKELRSPPRELRRPRAGSCRSEELRRPRRGTSRAALGAPAASMGALRGELRKTHGLGPHVSIGGQTTRINGCRR